MGLMSLGYMEWHWLPIRWKVAIVGKGTVGEEIAEASLHLPHKCKDPNSHPQFTKKEIRKKNPVQYGVWHY